MTPLDAAFTKPVAARTLAGLLAEKDIELVTEFNTGEVDGAGGRLVSFDGREVDFDLAVVVPLHGGASYVGRVARAGRRVRLRAHRRAHPAIQGAAQHLRHRRRRGGPDVEGRFGDPLRGRGDRRQRRAIPGRRGTGRRSTGTRTASSRAGFHKALLIDFNYDTEPLPGHFPTAVGLPLLKESRLNHLGKLMFAAGSYWHSLLPGRDIPGVTTAMPRAGKHSPGRRTG